MILRRSLAVATLAAAVVASLWADTAMKAVGAYVAFESPNYPEIKADEWAELSKEQLATTTQNVMNKSREMVDTWSIALDANQRIVRMLAFLLIAVSAVLSVLLWRSPPNKALQSDGSRPAGETRR